MKVLTACNRDCPDACSVVATVEQGRVTRLQGDPDHPVTSGFLCHRTNRFLERQYDPRRLTTPLVRRGGSLMTASLDAALDLIAEKLLAVRRESGGAAILHYRCGGSLGLLKHVTDAFFATFGPVTVKGGDVCSGAGDAAQLTDFGEEDCHDLFDLLESRQILVWGKNPYVSSVHLLPVLKEARSRGARLIVIDPVRTRAAALGERYVQVRPGGDSALALGVGRVLFERGLTDPAAPSYCDHLEEFRAECYARSLDDYARLADVTVEEIEALAQALADKPCAILVGWGMQRRQNGSQTVRLLDALGAISGNLGIAGGGVSFYAKRRGAFDLSANHSAAPPRTIPEPLLGRGILEATDPPIRVVWVTAGNPVVMLPDSQRTAEALRTRELTVVVDAFLTDSAREAHVVLPTTTMLEDDDLLGAYGNHWLHEVRPVVAPPAGVHTDLEIVRALAPRLGIGAPFTEPAETWKRRLLAKAAPLGASLEDLRSGRPVRNPFAKKVLFAERQFSTPSGRMNLIAEADPEPPKATPERHLLLMAQSTERAQGSQWQAQDQEGAAEALVHPEAAAGFRDGDPARIESERGSMRVTLRFDEKQRRDVLLMEKGGWLSAGRAANALIEARLTDAGECAVFLDTPVRILPD